MNIEKISANKSKAHIAYKNSEGKRIPGTTTITGVMNKPALVPWANKLGLEGIEVSKYVDDLAQIGTLAHYLVECHLIGATPDMSDYSANQISTAENSLIKYFDWESKNEFKAIGSEMPLISEKHQFGGTCDVYGILNGKKTLIDLKTCKAIYDEHFTQVVAYKHLLEENGHEVEDVRILRIGRTEDEGFEDIQINRVDLHWKRFLLCLDLYNVNKQIKR